MHKKQHRKALTIATALALTAGAVATAAPAQANSWSGFAQCPANVRIGAAGTKGPGANMRLEASGSIWYVPGASTGTFTHRHPTANGGGWSVSGSTTTAGWGVC